MKVHVLASLGSGVAAVLVPKCPICIAGWLSVVGIGAGVGATVALVLRPALVVLAIITAAFVLVGWVRARASAKAGCCSEHARAVAPSRGHADHS